VSGSDQPLLVVGWREWIGLPALGIARLQAKVDTGARTSSLHAEDVHVFRQDGRERVRFVVHPRRRTTRIAVSCVADLQDRRIVRSSTGHEEERYVIRTLLAWGGRVAPIEVNLTSRHGMGYRMLVGRQALAGRCLVDAGRSFLLGSHPSMGA